MVKIEEYFSSTEKLYDWAGFPSFNHPKGNLRNKIKSIFYSFVIISSILQLLLEAIFSEDLMAMTESLLICIIIFNAGNKFLRIMRGARKVIAILEELRNLIRVQLDVNWKKELLVASKERVDWLQKMFLWNFSICVAAAILNTTVDNVRHPQQLRFPLKMWFPFAPTTWFNVAVATVYQAVGSCSGIVIFTFGYMTFAGSIIHISTQLSILSEGMRNISTGASTLEQLESLNKCVRHHQIILRLVKSTNHVLGNVLFLEIILSSVQTCLVAFNCSQRPLSDPKQAFYLPFLLCTTILPATICWCGELLITKGEELTRAVYDCEWYKMKPKIRKEILMMQLQTSVPLTLNARNTFVMSLATFLKTIQTAYSYLTMLTSTDK